MEFKELNSVEEALARKEELLTLLEGYNNAIFDETEESKTEEFNEQLQSLNDEYAYVEEYIRRSHYKEPVEIERFLNKVSMWIWPYFLVLLTACFYPLFELIDINIIIPFLKIESVQNMLPVQQKTVILCAFAIYPIGLLLINLLVRLFLIKSKENKKAYLIASIIFWVLLLSSILILFLSTILPTLKDL